MNKINSHLLLKIILLLCLGLFLLHGTASASSAAYHFYHTNGLKGLLWQSAKLGIMQDGKYHRFNVYADAIVEGAHRPLQYSFLIPKQIGNDDTPFQSLKEFTDRGGVERPVTLASRSDIDSSDPEQAGLIEKWNNGENVAVWFMFDNGAMLFGLGAQAGVSPLFHAVDMEPPGQIKPESFEVTSASGRGATGYLFGVRGLQNGRARNAGSINNKAVASDHVGGLEGSSGKKRIYGILPQSGRASLRIKSDHFANTDYVANRRSNLNIKLYGAESIAAEDAVYTSHAGYGEALNAILEHDGIPLSKHTLVFNNSQTDMHHQWKWLAYDAGNIAYGLGAYPNPDHPDQYKGVAYQWQKPVEAVDARDRAVRFYSVDTDEVASFHYLEVEHPTANPDISFDWEKMEANWFVRQNNDPLTKENYPELHTGFAHQNDDLISFAAWDQVPLADAQSTEWGEHFIPAWVSPPVNGEMDDIYFTFNLRDSDARMFWVHFSQDAKQTDVYNSVSLDISDTGTLTSRLITRDYNSDGNPEATYGYPSHTGFDGGTFWLNISNGQARVGTVSDSNSIRTSPSPLPALATFPLSTTSFEPVQHFALSANKGAVKFSNINFVQQGGGLGVALPGGDSMPYGENLLSGSSTSSGALLGMVSQTGGWSTVYQTDAISGEGVAEHIAPAMGGHREVLIDLYEHGLTAEELKHNPVISVMQTVAATTDASRSRCGSDLYQYKVELLDSQKQLRAQADTGDSSLPVEPDATCNSNEPDWSLLHHYFVDYPENVRYVRMTLYGQDALVDGDGRGALFGQSVLTISSYQSDAFVNLLHNPGAEIALSGIDLPFWHVSTSDKSSTNAVAVISDDSVHVFKVDSPDAWVYRSQVVDLYAHGFNRTKMARQPAIRVSETYSDVNCVAGDTYWFKVNFYNRLGAYTGARYPAFGCGDGSLNLLLTGYGTDVRYIEFVSMGIGEYTTDNARIEVLGDNLLSNAWLEDADYSGQTGYSFPGWSEVKGSYALDLAGLADKPAATLSGYTNPASEVSHGDGTDSRWQRVDLIGMGYTAEELDSQPEVVFSELFGASACDDTYYLRVELQNEDGQPLQAAFDSGEVKHKFHCDDGSTPEWQLVSDSISGYGEGLRYILWEDGGKNARHPLNVYGPKFIAPTLALAPAPGHAVSHGRRHLGFWSDVGAGIGSAIPTLTAPLKHFLEDEYGWGRSTNKMVIDSGPGESGAGSDGPVYVFRDLIQAFKLSVLKPILEHGLSLQDPASLSFGSFMDIVTTRGQWGLDPALPGLEEFLDRKNQPVSTIQAGNGMPGTAGGCSPDDHYYCSNCIGGDGGEAPNGNYCDTCQAGGSGGGHCTCGSGGSAGGSGGGGGGGGSGGGGHRLDSCTNAQLYRVIYRALFDLINEMIVQDFLIEAAQQRETALRELVQATAVGQVDIEIPHLIRLLRYTYMEVARRERTVLDHLTHTAAEVVRYYRERLASGQVVGMGADTLALIANRFDQLIRDRNTMRDRITEIGDHLGYYEIRFGLRDAQGPYGNPPQPFVLHAAVPAITPYRPIRARFTDAPTHGDWYQLQEAIHETAEEIRVYTLHYEGLINVFNGDAYARQTYLGGIQYTDEDLVILLRHARAYLDELKGRFGLLRQSATAMHRIVLPNIPSGRILDAVVQWHSYLSRIRGELTRVLDQGDILELDDHYMEIEAGMSETDTCSTDEGIDPETCDDPDMPGPYEPVDSDLSDDECYSMDFESCSSAGGCEEDGEGLDNFAEGDGSTVTPGAGDDDVVEGFMRCQGIGGMIGTDTEDGNSSANDSDIDENPSAT